MTKAGGVAESLAHPQPQKRRSLKFSIADRAQAYYTAVKSARMEGTFVKNDTKLLQLLESDCTLNHDQLAAMTGLSADEVEREIKRMEAERLILGYRAVVDWDRTEREAVTALIEVKVTPQRGEGFDRVAERIYQYDEVESVYLMSGAFDLTVIISGRSLKEVAHFVGEKLATIEDVTGTATHFILHKYKENHLIFEKREEQQERFVLE